METTSSTPQPSQHCFHWPQSSDYVTIKLVELSRDSSPLMVYLNKITEQDPKLKKKQQKNEQKDFFKCK